MLLLSHAFRKLTAYPNTLLTFRVYSLTWTFSNKAMNCPPTLPLLELSAYITAAGVVRLHYRCWICTCCSLLFIESWPEKPLKNYFCTAYSSKIWHTCWWSYCLFDEKTKKLKSVAAILCKLVSCCASVVRRS